MKKVLVLLSVPFQAVLFGAMASMIHWSLGVLVFILWIAMGIKVLANYDKV
jgi:hypothetical protein